MQKTKSFSKKNKHARSTSLNLKLFINFDFRHNFTFVIKNRVNKTKVRVNTLSLRYTVILMQFTLFQYKFSPHYLGFKNSL